jgi:hypothetical protein
VSKIHKWFKYLHQKHSWLLRTQQWVRIKDFISNNNKDSNEEFKKKCPAKMSAIGTQERRGFTIYSCLSIPTILSISNYADPTKSFGLWQHILECEQPTSVAAITKRWRRSMAALRTSYRCTKKISRNWIVK